MANENKTAAEPTQAELNELLRIRREKLAEDIPAVWDILYEGSREARAVAADTLANVKKAMKIDYFSDRENV